MVLTNKKIYGLVNEIAGEQAVPIIEYLKNRKNVSEFIIADKVKMDMQTTRNILYTLNAHNVATYIRRKDRKKGWYISYWTFNRKRIKDLMEKLKREKIAKLTERLKKEETNKGNFFICSQACVRLDFEQSTEFDFKCPECGNLLNQQDNEKTIENIKGKIKDLETFDINPIKVVKQAPTKEKAPTVPSSSSKARTKKKVTKKKSKKKK